MSIYLKAAELDEWTSTLYLADKLEDGDFAEGEIQKILAWLEQRAARGDEYAIWRLGRCYFQGKCVPKNVSKAAELYGMAAKMKVPSASFDLGQCYEHGAGVAKDLQKARQLYEMAASLGNEDAKKRLEELAVVPQASSAQKKLVDPASGKKVATKPLHTPAASYPESLKRSGIEGEVEFEFFVLEDGTVDQVKILRTPHKQFGIAAEQAVSKWKFKPATVNGDPVKSKFRSSMKFVIK